MDARPLYTAMEALRPSELAWVAPPYGELHWTQAGLDLGLKLSPIVWVFTWHDLAMPYLEAAREGSPPALHACRPPCRSAYVRSRRRGKRCRCRVRTSRNPWEYSDLPLSAPTLCSVVTGMGIAACQATGSGGDLTVNCTNDQAGELVMQEHAWSGWRVRRDGAPAALEPGPWLRVAAPAGQHTYEFRYRPWDALLGGATSVIGAILTLGLWMRLRRGVQGP